MATAKAARKKKPTYELRPGFRVNGSVQEIAEAIESLRASTAAALKSGDVVRAAKNPKSVLHAEFDWDVKSAAEAHWNEHARYLLRCYRVYKVDRKLPVPVRAVLSIPDDPNNRTGPKSYYAEKHVKKTPALRRQALREAILYLKAGRDKYCELAEELGHIWEAIDALDIDEVLEAL